MVITSTRERKLEAKGPQYGWNECNLLFFSFQRLSPRYASNTAGRRKPEIRASELLSSLLLRASATLNIYVDGHFVSLAMPIVVCVEETGIAYL